MSEFKFKVGDRVKIANVDRSDQLIVPDMYREAGECGTVVAIGTSHYPPRYNVRQDNGHCWWWHASSLCLESESPRFQPNEMLIVMTDGNETRAITKQDGKIIHDVTLHRHPDDEPNLLNAAKYAVERIERISKRKEKTPVRKPLNMDVVCVENYGLDDVFTIGKVYHIKGGRLSYNGRNSCDSAYGVYFSLSDINDPNNPKRTAARFIEYKGGA